MKKIIIFIALVALSTAIYAQPPKPGGDGSNPPGTGNSVNNAPIGTGTLFLLGLGAAYTGYRVLRKKKEIDNIL